MICIAYGKDLGYLFTQIESKNQQVLDLYAELVNERQKKRSADENHIQYTNGSDKLKFLFKSEGLYVGLIR